jgi:TrmH family RNA methyltransferase
LLNPDHFSLNFQVALVRTQTAANIGAVARLCTNYGLAHVCLVNVLCDPSSVEARKMAREHSKETLFSFPQKTTLAESLQDCHFAVAFTRRTGSERQINTQLDDVFNLSLKGKVGLVFGNEESGLSNEELSACSHVCSLPTASQMPSLNLSQAVAVVVSRLYQIHEQGVIKETKPKNIFWERAEYATLEKYNALFTRLEETMIAAGLTTQGNPEKMLDVARKVFLRSQLTHREVNVFHGLLSAIIKKIN